MIYSSISPSEKFKPFIKSIWMLEGGSDESDTRYRFIPDGYVEISFHLKQPWVCYINQESKRFTGTTNFVGQFTQCLDVILPENLKIVYIKFYPWVPYALFGIPLNEFTDKNVQLDEIFGREIEFLYEQLLFSKNLVEMRAAIEFWLAKKVNNLMHLDKDVAKIGLFIIENQGAAQINDILFKYSRSQRRLQQQFTEFIGVSPKYLARIRRVYKAAKTVHSSNNLTQTAYELGYYDQSHFIRDFKHFTGFAPLEFGKRINPSGRFNNFSVD